jgi:flagellar motor switch protein FliN
MTSSKDKATNNAAESGIIIDTASSRKSRLRKTEADATDKWTGIEFLSDVRLKVSVILAETKLPVRELLTLGMDSVLQLNKLLGEPVDIYVENQKLGRGEVIVLQEKLRIRLLEVTPPSGFEASPRAEEI